MRTPSTCRAAINATAWALISAGWCGAAHANGTDSPEGTPGVSHQAITAASTVDIDTQRRLGLVTVNGGCSGTLLNRFWVLTARHCVQVNATIVNPPTMIPALLPANSVTVTAEWAPGRVGVASRLVDLGGTNLRDIVLVYLARADLGEAPTQSLYLVRRPTPPFLSDWVGRQLGTDDLVTQYGRGLMNFARVAANGTVTLATASPTYRSANFNPTNITGTDYQLSFNAAKQVGHGGDSGGPTVVIRDGVNVGIAGVQSTCNGTFAPGAPAPPPTPWRWATGISSCSYVSVQPIVREIGRAMREDPYCQPLPGCHMAPIVNYVLTR